MKQEQLSKLNRAKQAMKREDNHIAEVNQRMEEQLKADKLQFIDADEQLAKSNTVGKVIADKVAKIGGSWGFVISFMFKTNQRTNIQTKLLSSKLDHLMRYQRNQTEMLEVIVEMADEGNSIDTNKLSEKLGETIERKNGKTTLL